MNDLQNTHQRINTTNAALETLSDSVSDLLDTVEELVQYREIFGKALDLLAQKLDEVGLVSCDGEIITNLNVLTEDLGMLEQTVTDMMLDGIDDEAPDDYFDEHDDAYYSECDDDAYGFTGSDDTSSDEGGTTYTFDIEATSNGIPVFTSTRTPDMTIERIFANTAPSYVDPELEAILAELNTPMVTAEPIPTETITSSPIDALHFDVAAAGESSYVLEASKQLRYNAEQLLEAGHLTTPDAMSLLHLSYGELDENFKQSVDVYNVLKIVDGEYITPEHVLHVLIGTYLRVISDGSMSAYKSLVNDMYGWKSTSL